MKPPRVLIVAGSDSGGGAGIQADIKTVTMIGGFATTAITAITAQNTLGVSAVMPVPAAMVVQQIDAVLSDIGTDAVKIGMIGSADTVGAIRERLGGTGHPIVFDPVMVATSGAALADEATIAAFEALASLATLITPNAPELAAMTGAPVESLAELEAAARILAGRSGTPVLAKGGHLAGETLTDLLVGPDGSVATWSSARIDSRNTHGTGCTLASAIATHVAAGRSLADSIGRARDFVRIAMLAAPGFGRGHGPMGHHAAAYGNTNLNQLTLPARDYAASVQFYRKLGLTQIVDAPERYARFECPGGATLSIHVDPDPVIGDALAFFEIPDLDSAVQRLATEGLAIDEPPEDKPWGWREARLRDPAGNRLALFRAAGNRRFPAWRLAN